MRGLLCGTAALVCAASFSPAPASQRDEATPFLPSGDGTSDRTAYVVPLVVDEYLGLRAQHLDFISAVGHPDSNTDAITVRDQATGLTKVVLFRVVPPDNGPDVGVENNAMRAVMTSGDGLSARTAFVIQNRKWLHPENVVLALLGVHALAETRTAVEGCSYDVIRAANREVWFSLDARTMLPGECRLDTAK